MKLKIKRETTIGLSVLLVLLVILGTVAVRRLMRRDVPPLEEAIAKAEEKPFECPPTDRGKREPDLFPKPVVLAPVETPHRDTLQPPDDPGHWNANSKEGKRQTPTIAKSSERVGERTTTFKSPELPPAETDDRYSPAATALSAERELKANSRSTVIQVSNGETSDSAPRPLDKYAGERRPTEPYPPVRPGPGGMTDAFRPAPAVDQRPTPHDGSVADMRGDREAARLSAEKAREREFRGDAPAATGTYVAAPPPRYGYDATSESPAGNRPPRYPSVPPSDAASNYSAAPDGYVPENSLRRGDEVAAHSGPSPAARRRHV